MTGWECISLAGAGRYASRSFIRLDRDSETTSGALLFCCVEFPRGAGVLRTGSGTWPMALDDSAQPETACARTLTGGPRATAIDHSRIRVVTGHQCEVGWLGFTLRVIPLDHHRHPVFLTPSKSVWVFVKNTMPSGNRPPRDGFSKCFSALFVSAERGS